MKKETKNNLPDGWRKEELAKIGRIVTGNTPPRAEERYYGGSIPWIKPEDLDKEIYVSKSSEYLSNEGGKVARLLPEGSILVSCIGNVGKMAIAKTEIATNQQINSLIIKKDYDVKYIYYALKNRVLLLEGKVNQALVPILNATAFGKLKIPIPETKDIQFNISSEIDYEYEQIEIMRQAVLRQKEAISALQGAILREAFPYKEGDKLPQGWRWEKLGTMGVLSQGGTPSTDNLKYWNGSIPFITGADVTNLYVSRARSFLTEEGLNSGKTERCEKGDLLIVSRTRVGRTGIALTTLGVSQDVSVLKVEGGYEPIYLALFLKSISARLEDACQGSTIKGLTRSYIENILIPLPPTLDKQIIISNKIERKMNKIESMINGVNHKMEAVESLRSAVLREAFDFEGII